MKTLALLIVASVTAVFSLSRAEWEKWFPDGSVRWNAFALCESGLGRMLSRAMTKDADRVWHHGMSAPKPVENQNALSRWIDQGVVSLGFQGRLLYHPAAKYPIRPSEVHEVLAKTERDLSTAFTLDLENYEAYDAYVLFLTTHIRETEFGLWTAEKRILTKLPRRTTNPIPEGTTTTISPRCSDFANGSGMNNTGGTCVP
jgi:hypothetical protein